MKSALSGKRMDERALERIALGTFIIGMSILVLLAQLLPHSTVPHLEDTAPNQEIFLEGTIQRLHQQEKVYFLEVGGFQQVTTSVILFPKQSLYLHEGDVIRVKGMVEEYQNKKELIAHQIEVLQGKISVRENGTSSPS